MRVCGVVRPVVLVLARYYLPGSKAGGPIRSIGNMVRALGDACRFRVVTSDRDHADPVPFPGVAVNAWNEFGGGQVFYADRSGRRGSAVAAIIRETDPDVVYLNSFFSPAFTVSPLVRHRWAGLGRRARWIIAPRGEFSPGALGFKASKKKAFLRFARSAGLLRGITWQATSQSEVDDIRRETGAADAAILLAANITEPVGDLVEVSTGRPGSGPLKVCFVSRVSPKKNLAFAVEVLARAGRPVEFDIYGPIEDEALVATCDRIAAAAERLTVRWHGPVPHEEVRGIFARHDLFLFPTLGENFGHVIFESLAAGTPVLVSDRTPWQDLDATGAGWVRSLDRIEDFTAVVDALAALPADERLAMRRRAHGYARAVHASSPAIEQTRRLLLGTAS